MSKTKKKVEFGDFQTPDVLSRRVCELLRSSNVSPHSIVEPTCGTGSFLRASAVAFPQCIPLLGFDVNPDHVRAARTVEGAEVRCEDFFQKNWSKTLDSLREPILVIGNPPWVTNSTLGTLNSTNLPVKSNFQNLNGFDAITGKSNFDVSEWMLLHLLERLSGREAVLAMLCKTVVARKVLHHAWKGNWQIARSAIYSIDAAKYFEASVDACLLVCTLKPGVTSRKCASYPGIEESARRSNFGLHDRRLVADLDALGRYGHLYGTSPLRWRSGVKHDCSQIMELSPKGSGEFENGLGEIVMLESTYLYPMLKSSQLVKQDPTPSRYMLVTQQAVGDDTSLLERTAPRTWDYLRSHADRLDARASSIYKNRPRFCVFGVGPYTFAPWKSPSLAFTNAWNFVV